jgi:hypothetical protein
VTSEILDPGSVNSERLIRFLEDARWKRTGGRDGLYARYSPPNEELGVGRTSLLIPLDQHAPDYRDLLRDALDTLRRLPHDVAAFALPTRLASAPTDEFSFSKKTTAPEGWISWDEGESLIASARSLLVVGAKSVRERRRYFGNRYGQFANRFIDGVMMGQTDVASYVVRAYVPVDRAIPFRSSRGPGEGASNERGEISSRQVSEAVAATLGSVIEALAHHRRHNSLSAFTRPELGLSYEAVNAVKHMVQNADHASITVAWERAAADPHTHEQEFNFTRSDIPALEIAAIALATPESGTDARAVGAVHLLTRTERGASGVVGLTTIDGKPARKVRVHLSAADYGKALDAHASGRLVEVEGTLEREGNMSHLYGAHVIRIL